MRGFAQDITPAYGEPVPFEHQVVAVVCASDFPEPALITDTLRKGQAHDPHTLWVVRDKDKLAVAALEELGVEYLPVPLSPWGKVELPLHGPLKERQRTRPTEVLCDVRRTYRETELIGCSSMVVVFAKPDPGSLSPLFDHAALEAKYPPGVPRKVRLIVRGKPKVRKRQGRKPVGV